MLTRLSAQMLYLSLFTVGMIHMQQKTWTQPLPVSVMR